MCEGDTEHLSTMSKYLPTNFYRKLPKSFADITLVMKNVTSQK